MITLHFYGSMREKFGTGYQLQVKTPGEAIRLMNANFGGKMFKWLRARQFHILGGGPKIEDAEDLGIRHPMDMTLSRSKVTDFHVLPRGHGAVSTKGILSIVIGTVLVAGAIILSGGTLAAPLAALGSSAMAAGTLWGTVASFGFAMILGGTMQILSPTATSDYGSREDADSKPSSMFTGPVNTAQQGNAIPIIYGEVFVGSQMVSVGMSTARVDVNA